MDFLRQTVEEGSDLGSGDCPSGTERIRVATGRDTGVVRPADGFVGIGPGLNVIEELRTRLGVLGFVKKPVKEGDELPSGQLPVGAERIFIAAGCDTAFQQETDSRSHAPVGKRDIVEMTGGLFGVRRCQNYVAGNARIVDYRVALANRTGYALAFAVADTAEIARFTFLSWFDATIVPDCALGTLLLYVARTPNQVPGDVMPSAALVKAAKADIFVVKLANLICIGGRVGVRAVDNIGQVAGILAVIDKNRAVAGVVIPDGILPSFDS